MESATVFPRPPLLTRDEPCKGQGPPYVRGHSNTNNNNNDESRSTYCLLWARKSADSSYSLYHRAKLVEISPVWLNSRFVLQQNPKGTLSMPHPAKSRNRSRAIRVAGSDFTDYANPPRLITYCPLRVRKSADLIIIKSVASLL